MKKKILYIMHVDWHWIKQRPQFLAEEMALNFDVLVVHPHNNRRENISINKSNVKRVKTYSLPFSRFKCISIINNYIRNFHFLFLVLSYKPTVVWITYPTLISEVGLRLLKNKVIVYDCMDDAQEFSKNEIDKKSISCMENVLLMAADLVLVSSENLLNKVLRRGAVPTNLALVRNAFGGKICVDVSSSSDQVNTKKGVFTILYIGTISDYIDFNLLLNCLDCNDFVEFHFFGPVLVNVPAHERLILHGIVEHASLPSLAQQYDCFIMPFITNELIQGVDPVKLYEYINFNKNIICPYYDEIDRFSTFVFFYRDKDEFVSVVKNIAENNTLKYDNKQRNNFLISNSWEVRAKQTINLINNISKLKSS